MTQSKKTITRRDFLRGTTCATFALAMGLFPEEEKIVELPKKTSVILIRDPDVMDAKGRIDGKVIQRMLDEAVTALFEKKEPVEAWKLLVKPEDIVGIKSNVWGPLPTPKELEQAIKRRVMDAGVQEKNIEIDDRGVLQSKIFGQATALINARPLRTHAWSGVGGCIKNYIMFVPKPSKYHGNSCEDLGAIWNLPLVKGKTKLNILVMLEPLFHGVGRHHFDATYT
ncbi:MAG: twin-arginine translocation signal domain-containing protein, partial [Candidatus Zixiibacteriota bacterium]